VTSSDLAHVSQEWFGIRENATESSPKISGELRFTCIFPRSLIGEQQYTTRRELYNGRMGQKPLWRQLLVSQERPCKLFLRSYRH